MVAVIFCGLVCNTCDLLKDVVKAPTVSLESVDFSDINFTGLTLLSKISVNNDNSIEIPLPKIDWGLKIVDIPFLDGIIQSNGSLKARGTTEVEIPVSFTYVDLIKAITAMTDENAQYKINMETHIPVPGLGDLSWPFEKVGKVPLMRIPDIKFEAPPKASFTYGLIPGIPTGGQIDFNLNLKNASNVAVLINDLSFVLKIGNTSLPKWGIPENSKPKIDAGATEKIPISLSLTAANITAIGINLLTGNISNLSLTGDYKLGIPDFPLFDKLLGDTFTLGN